MSNEMDNNTGASNGNGNGTSSWAMWQRLVLSEIKRLDEGLKEAVKEIGDLKIKLAVLQTKAAMWGAIAALITTGIVEFVMYLMLGHMHVPH